MHVYIYIYISYIWALITSRLYTGQSTVWLMWKSCRCYDVIIWEGCNIWTTVYPKKYAHGFCFVVLCCGYTLTDFPISIRLTSLALWQSNDCPNASKATLMNMDKYFMWIHYKRLHNHNKAKHNKTVCIFLGIYCNWLVRKCHTLCDDDVLCWGACHTYIIVYISLESGKGDEWDDVELQLKLTMYNMTHHSDVIMGTMASQITSFTIVYSTVYSGAD